MSVIKKKNTIKNREKTKTLTINKKKNSKKKGGMQLEYLVEVKNILNTNLDTIFQGQSDSAISNYFKLSFIGEAVTGEFLEDTKELGLDFNTYVKKLEDIFNSKEDQKKAQVTSLYNTIQDMKKIIKKVKTEKSYQVPSSMTSLFSLNSSATTRYNEMKSDIEAYLSKRNLFLEKINTQSKVESSLAKNFIPNLQEFTQICSDLLKLCIMCPNSKRKNFREEIHPTKNPQFQKLQYKSSYDVLAMLNKNYDLNIVIDKEKIGQVPEKSEEGLYKFDFETHHITKSLNLQDEIRDLESKRKKETQKIELEIDEQLHQEISIFVSTNEEIESLYQQLIDLKVLGIKETNEGYNFYTDLSINVINTKVDELVKEKQYGEYVDQQTLQRNVDRVGNLLNGFGKIFQNYMLLNSDQDEDLNPIVDYMMNIEAAYVEMKASAFLTRDLPTEKNNRQQVFDRVKALCTKQRAKFIPVIEQKISDIQQSGQKTISQIQKGYDDQITKLEEQDGLKKQKQKEDSVFVDPQGRVLVSIPTTIYKPLLESLETIIDKVSYFIQD